MIRRHARPHGQRFLEGGSEADVDNNLLEALGGVLRPVTELGIHWAHDMITLGPGTRYELRNLASSGVPDITNCLALTLVSNESWFVLHLLLPRLENL